MSKPLFKTYYDPPEKIQKVLDTETKLVSQAEADMCGLEYQLKRYGIDGLQARFEQMKSKFGYADTRLIPDFAELQNRIVAGEKYFNDLPSEIRAKFNHEPAKFYDYIQKNPVDSLEKGYISSEKKDELLKALKPSVDTTPVVDETPVKTEVSEENPSA